MENSTISPILGRLTPATLRLAKQAQEPEGNSRGFLSFIWNEPANRQLLIIALAGTVVQFVIFKHFYPFADFFSDSYSYIYAAYAHLNVSIWPIGYSKFLLLAHFLTHNDKMLIAFQYFLLEVSALHLFFSWRYFLPSSKVSVKIIFAFLFFNPMFLFLSNYVNSDPLFLAVSILWFTEILWILNCRNKSHLITQAILLFLAFTIRNNAYIYPIITLVAFAISDHKFWTKTIGALLGIIFILFFILYTRKEAVKVTGIAQYSLFTGWQLANNALYIYDKSKVDSQSLPPNTREINNLAIKFTNSIPAEGHQLYRKFLSDYVGNYFIRQPNSPLKIYLERHYVISDENSVIRAWGESSQVFNKFGEYVIGHNQLVYIKYFILPNIENYFLPPLEKLAIYNLGSDDVEPLGQFWFDYKTNKITSISRTGQSIMLFLFPGIFLIINVFLLLGILSRIIFKDSIKSKVYRRNNILFESVMFFNCIFCICSTIIVLRYEIFPMLIGLILLCHYYDMSKYREYRYSIIKKFIDKK